MRRQGTLQESSEATATSMPERMPDSGSSKKQQAKNKNNHHIRPPSPGRIRPQHSGHHSGHPERDPTLTAIAHEGPIGYSQQLTLTSVLMNGNVRLLRESLCSNPRIPLDALEFIRRIVLEVKSEIESVSHQLDSIHREIQLKLAFSTQHPLSLPPPPLQPIGMDKVGGQQQQQPFQMALQHHHHHSQNHHQQFRATVIAHHTGPHPVGPLHPPPPANF